ncbi:MAG: ribonuclease P protein subunit [Candidatus Diapherotrites archaeon]|nr:ribonuclease P protein subunit [Candidatus Micrarchaeota archaeon]MBU1939498.1 ribonuclease P protein subunit [Candidatus Micrarchaeota archaeon]
MVRVEITKKNLPAHELIGLRVKVAECADAGMKGIKGKVVDESRNVLIIDLENGKGERRIPKKDAVFEFEIAEGKVLLEGRKIIARPEDRVKLWRNKNG